MIQQRLHQPVANAIGQRVMGYEEKEGTHDGHKDVRELGKVVKSFSQNQKPGISPSTPGAACSTNKPFIRRFDQITLIHRETKLSNDPDNPTTQKNRLNLRRPIEKPPCLLCGRKGHWMRLCSNPKQLSAEQIIRL